MGAGGEKASGSVLGKGSNESRGQGRGRSLRTEGWRQSTAGGRGLHVHGRTGRGYTLVVAQGTWPGLHGPERSLESVLRVLRYTALILQWGKQAVILGFCSKRGEKLDGWMNETPPRAASENSILMATGPSIHLPINTSIDSEYMLWAREPVLGNLRQTEEPCPLGAPS